MGYMGGGVYDPYHIGPNAGIYIYWNQPTIDRNVNFLLDSTLQINIEEHSTQGHEKWLVEYSSKVEAMAVWELLTL